MKKKINKDIWFIILLIFVIYMSYDVTKMINHVIDEGYFDDQETIDEKKNSLTKKEDAELDVRKTKRFYKTITYLTLIVTYIKYLIE